jgi:hypothetical protein
MRTGRSAARVNVLASAIRCRIRAATVKVVPPAPATDDRLDCAKVSGAFAPCVSPGERRGTKQLFPARRNHAAAAASDCAAVSSICTSVSKVTIVASLLFTCPNTSRKLSTGVEMDVPGLRAHWNSTLRLDCPHCRDAHDISVRQVYMDAALEGLDQSRLISSRNSGARARKAIITARSRPALSPGSGTPAG